MCEDVCVCLRVCLYLCSDLWGNYLCVHHCSLHPRLLSYGTVCKKSPCTLLCWPQLFIITLYLLVYLFGYLLFNLFVVLPWAVKQLKHALKMRLLQMLKNVNIHVLHKMGLLLWRRLTLGWSCAPILARGTESSPTVTPTNAFMAPAAYCNDLSSCKTLWLCLCWGRRDRPQTEPKHLCVFQAESIPLFCCMFPHTLIPCITGHTTFLYSFRSTVNKLAIQSGITLSLPYHSSSLSLAQCCSPSVTRLNPVWYSANLFIYSKYSIAPLVLRVILCSVRVIIPDNKQKQMGK